MKKISLFLILCMSIANAEAQQKSVVPEAYVLEKEQDYKAYEQDIMNCIRLTANTPPGEENLEYHKAAKFIMDWVSGCPYVTITLSSELIPYKMTDKKQNLLMLYLGSWVKYVVENNEGNQEKAALAAIEGTLDYYQKYRKYFGKDKIADKFIKMREDKSLEKYIREHINR